jgi:hypothetical protein
VGCSLPTDLCLAVFEGEEHLKGEKGEKGVQGRTAAQAEIPEKIKFKKPSC